MAKFQVRIDKKLAPVVQRAAATHGRSLVQEVNFALVSFYRSAVPADPALESISLGKDPALTPAVRYGERKP